MRNNPSKRPIWTDSCSRASLHSSKWQKLLPWPAAGRRGWTKRKLRYPLAFCKMPVGDENRVPTQMQVTLKYSAVQYYSWRCTAVDGFTVRSVYLKNGDLKPRWMLQWSEEYTHIFSWLVPSQNPRDKALKRNIIRVVQSWRILVRPPRI